MSETMGRASTLAWYSSATSPERWNTALPRKRAKQASVTSPTKSSRLMIAWETAIPRSPMRSRKGARRVLRAAPWRSGTLLASSSRLATPAGSPERSASTRRSPARARTARQWVRNRLSQAVTPAASKRR